MFVEHTRSGETSIFARGCLAYFYDLYDFGTIAERYLIYGMCMVFGISFQNSNDSDTIELYVPKPS